MPRHPDDFYATDPRAVAPLLAALGWQWGGLTLWENSCGMGHLSRPLAAAGHTVISTDLVDRGYGIGGVDFLEPSIFDTFRYDGIVMNPPFKHAQKFIEKSLTIAPVVCAFLRLAFLESQGRYDFFKSNPPWKVLVFSDRVPSAINADFENVGAGKTPYCWIIWTGGHVGQTMMEWVRL